ncbi:hypothetical protein ZHAS_00019731 [Anopheles sinensis]|uniref:Uncharacterized protein n=1 Tax=Anopheles sinensis TaxID=74873 RepID=A0A084WN57_ANOSI|nr:hypothetical protein ZHAS_00019731 [Anopheles sinensis]
MWWCGHLNYDRGWFVREPVAFDKFCQVCAGTFLHAHRTCVEGQPLPDMTGAFPEDRFSSSSGVFA